MPSPGGAFPQFVRLRVSLFTAACRCISTLPMHRDVKEMLIGSAVIILFGAAVIASPPFARFVDQYFFSYIQMIWDLVRHVL